MKNNNNLGIYRFSVDNNFNPDYSRNTFIGQIKKNTEIGSYRALKEMASDHVELKRVAADQLTD